MSKHKLQYLVSTDSIGFLGTSNQFIKLWQEYFDNKILDGVESIAFGPVFRLIKMEKFFNKNNIHVLSYHGKTGDVKTLSFLKRIILLLVNMTFINTGTLLSQFGKNTDILFHASFVENKIVEKIILKFQPAKLWIENNPSGETQIYHTIDQIDKYRSKKINAFGLLDIFHFVRNLSTAKLLRNWPNVVDQLEYYVRLKDKNGKQFFTGIHFPIGTRLADSLPIDRLTNPMLKLFAKKIIPHVERVVFENQQKNIGLLFSTKKMLEAQKVRNKSIVERLRKTGIIC